MNRFHLISHTFFVLMCLIGNACSNPNIKKIKPGDFHEFQFSYKMQDIEVLEYYQFTGNKIFTKNWSDIYLCQEYGSKDTIIMLDIKSEAPDYISERKNSWYMIFERDKQKCYTDVSVTYPDSIKLSNNWKLLFGKLRFLND